MCCGNAIEPLQPAQSGHASHFCLDVPLSGSSVPRPVVILAGTSVVPCFKCYLVQLAECSTAWNGNVRYFAHEFIFWLKVRQNAGVLFYFFWGGAGLTAPDQTPVRVVREVATPLAPTPSRFGRAWGQTPWCWDIIM